MSAVENVHDRNINQRKQAVRDHLSSVYDGVTHTELHINMDVCVQL